MRTPAPSSSRSARTSQCRYVWLLLRTMHAAHTIRHRLQAALLRWRRLCSVGSWGRVHASSPRSWRQAPLPCAAPWGRRDCADLARLCCRLAASWVLLQGVATELTRDAYETHARIALEAADLAEFRQCLARLKQLYRAGVSEQPSCRPQRPAARPLPGSRASLRTPPWGRAAVLRGPINQHVQQPAEAAACWC